VAAIVSTFNAIAATIQAIVDPGTTPVQAPVDAITLTVKASSRVLMAIFKRPIAPAIEASVDHIAAPVEPVFDAITAPIECIVDGVTPISLGGGRRQQCGQGNGRQRGKRQCVPDGSGQHLHGHFRCASRAFVVDS
jgi:hypothetical protein